MSDPNRTRADWLDLFLLEPSFEGPVYADRINGRLTFLDWDNWTEQDQDKYSGEFMKRAPKRVVFDFMKAKGLIDARFS